MQPSETTKKIAVLLLNLGGPEKQKDVQSFLYNLFSDRQIIRLGPALLQKPLAALIAWRRAPVSKANYRKIGGGSPIGRITARQALALQQALNNDGNFVVYPCMRYWHPFTSEVIQQLSHDNIEKIIALPLYPHFSKATSGSSFDDLSNRLARTAQPPIIKTVQSWPDEPAYIACLASRIKEGLELFDAPPQVVYSAHSLPQQFIDEGDPYVEELHRTITAVEKQTGQAGILCYQSRSGPVQWLEPSTPDTLTTLAAKGCTNILMVPISFVSDHIETLYEVDMLYKGQARDLGMRLESTRAPNDDPAFIQALRSLVLTAC